MTNTPTFKDLKNDVWSLRLTTADIDRVRAHVKDNNGQPIDLLDMAEKGDFSSVTYNLRVFNLVVFWLLQEQIADRFSVEQYDAEHAKEYALDPDAKNISTLQKAANWFASRIGGDQFADMAKAFVDSVLNFIDPKVRKRLQVVLEKQEQLREAILDKATTDTLNQLSGGLDALSSNPPESSDLTPESTPSEN